MQLQLESSRVGDATDIFAGCTFEQYKDVRKKIVSVILHTDMVHHMQMIKDMQLQMEIYGDTEEEVKNDSDKSAESQARIMCAVANKDDEGKLMIMQLFMHAADIS